MILWIEDRFPRFYYRHIAGSWIGRLYCFLRWSRHVPIMMVRKSGVGAVCLLCGRDLK